MSQTMAVEVTGYQIHINRDDVLGHYIEVVAVVSDPYGNEIGEVSTDTYEFARNLPHALIKVYILNRKINSGALVPEVNL
jgi:hypothetical protein